MVIALSNEGRMRINTTNYGEEGGKARDVDRSADPNIRRDDGHLESCMGVGV
jgi:hypothetical protein